MKKPTVGFIGQGYIGKNMADDFEERGYQVVRYGLESPYNENKEQIKSCDVVFIAVPAPTISGEVVITNVQEGIELTRIGAVVVIKSTLLPGTTKRLQDSFPDRIILFSPEFLSKATAPDDARRPAYNVVGVTISNDVTTEAAKHIHSLLPDVEHSFTVDASSAELYKYVHNVHGYVRIVLSNIFYDLAESAEANWDEIHPIINVNPMMSPWYNQPIHKSGRGAGGGCFIKDYAAFKAFAEQKLSDDTDTLAILKAIEKKNLELLKQKNKDQEAVREVYGNG